MNYILSDNGLHLRFAPLTLTRPLGTVRIGIMTNEERIKLFDKTATIYFETESYLTTKFPAKNNAQDDIVINAQVILTATLMNAISQLNADETLVHNDTWIAKKGVGAKSIQFNDTVLIINQRWEIFQKNDVALEFDFEWITKGRTTQQISATNTVIGNINRIFLEEGASVEASILNTTSGSIYLAKNAEIMEGSVVRGGLALGESAALKLATKVYGATTLGQHCKVGGEVNNVVFQAYSNKGHDGFLGNALIGEWCNLGADTNCSNLKNNYSNVTTYSYETQQQEKTNVQFMGLVMGDHSKCGINTMFNTATVCGVSCNVYGGDFPPKFIPSFSWGGSDGFEKFTLEKAIQAAQAMMNRRHIDFTDGDRKIFEELF
ncbi:MAG TPA: putative sugar nucleotidyl transferase [Crocinitomicaceae bacterium]|nr:putative sugar nucleotidyl transferase [Crocinitomicaceae bacterium]